MKKPVKIVLLLAILGGLLWLFTRQSAVERTHVATAKIETNTAQMQENRENSPLPTANLESQHSAEQNDLEAQPPNQHIAEKNDSESTQNILQEKGASLEHERKNAVEADTGNEIATSEEKNDSAEYDIIVDTVRKGETIEKIFAKAACEHAEEYISAIHNTISMRSLHEGQPYTLVLDAETHSVQKFEYEIDSHRLLIVENKEKVDAHVETMEYAILLSKVHIPMKKNVLQAVCDTGESAHLALKIMEMFAYEIDFTQDPGKGDFLTVLVEKKYHEGVYRGYGRILAACLRYKGKMHEAFLFRDGNGPARYYTRKGENLRRNFLQAPLAVTRITSNFSKNRMHPILGYSRPHEGIDYAAPMGTPVKAVGDGEIAAQGWVSGYGNQVVITHAGGLESLYSHLAGFARGINKGTHVQQGQTIGYVGSTGLSTGPHLDFRLRLNGKFINPAVKINPRNAPVSAKNMAAFLRTMNKELRLLNGHSSFSEYNSNDLVPEMVRVGK